MPTLFVPHQLREFAAGLERLDIPEGTLRQALRALETEYPLLVAHVRQDDRLMPGLAVSIDGTVVSCGLLEKKGPTSDLHLLPAVGGG